MIYAMLNTMPFDSWIDPFVSFVTTLCSKIIQVKTRPDTWQSTCGRLGRSSDAKIARNSEMLPTHLPTIGQMDQATLQDVESRVRN